MCWLQNPKKNNKGSNLKNIIFSIKLVADENGIFSLSVHSIQFSFQSI